MDEDDIKDIITKKTKHLSGMFASEYRECCYSCEHSRIIKGDKCRCLKKHDKIIGKVYMHRCSSWKDAELVECAICEKFVRVLGNHLRVHNMNAITYREMLGINRTTSIASGVTKRSFSAEAKKNDNGNRLTKYLEDNGRYYYKGMKVEKEG